MLDLIRYAIERARHPAAADFISMGRGIAAREKRCRRAWSHHLRLTREFIRAGTADLAPGARIAVLGAGRLLDVPLAEIAARAAEIHLFDADPGCLPHWRKLPQPAARIVPHLGDLTGSLETWTAELERELLTGAPTKEALADFLMGRQLRSPVVLGSFDAVISVNLLSQIPIYWRDRVEAQIRRCRRGWENDARIQSALDKNSAVLQAGHLGLLEQSGAPRVILITDERFFYYRRDSAPWQEEQSLYVPTVELSGCQAARTDSWLWHIMPQGIEAPDYGSIHRVRAVEFRRVNER